MACNNSLTNCAPCHGCKPSTPEPPRCDVELTDGVYTNATVYVENGCIIAVESGSAPLYTPDPCCEAPSSGGGNGGGEPCDCPPGDPGKNATIDINQTLSVPYGSPPRVENVGTTTNAVLDFYIPAGKPGDTPDEEGGVTDDRGGISIEDGRITLLPATWPPVLYVNATAQPNNVQLSAGIPDAGTGIMSLQLNLTQFQNDLMYVLRQEMEQMRASLQNQIDSLQNQVTSLNGQINSINGRLNTCCP